MAVHVRSVRLSNDVTIPYAECGESARTPILFVPGYADSWRSFERVLAHLPSSVHAFAITPRGQGDAGKPVDGYQTRGLASDLMEFGERVGLGRFVVVGASSGGLVARRLAIDHPHRVAGLVLVGSPLRLWDHPAAQSLFDRTISTLVDPVSPDFVREFQLSTLTRPVPPEFLQAMVDEALKVPAHVWREALRGLLADRSDLELARIRCPVLALWGDADTLVGREDQEQLAAAIPGARLKVYPGAGHALYWEDPEGVATDLTTFLVGIGEAAPATGHQP